MFERSDRRSSADVELTHARSALAGGDPNRAAAHLADVLAQAPTLPDAHEVLARLGARPDGGVDLFPLGVRPFVGTVVARAHLLAASGRPGEGLELLATATAHAPATPWAAVAWVTVPDLPARLDPEQIARVLMQVCAAVPDPVPMDWRAALEPYLRLAGSAVACYPRHGLLLGAASALARRLGLTAAAVDWARRGAREFPSKLSEVWLGYAYRSAGRVDEGLAALRRAVQHEPDDLAVYADIASTLADSGRLDEALEWIDEALRRDPTFDCAVHTAHRLRYRRDARVAHLVALADFSREHPDDSHDHGDLAECCAPVPWLGHLPGQPAAAGVDGAGSAGGVDGAAGWPTEPGYPPDRRDVGGPETPSSPSPRAVERIRQVTAARWPHPPAAYDAAVSLSALPLGELLALLACPPPPPSPRAAPAGEPAPTVGELWTRAVRVWACLGLLHQRADEPWADSVRRRTLVDLVQGQPDEIAEAAGFALVTAAWVDPLIRADVAAVVAALLASTVRAADQRPVPALPSVAHLALATPGLDPAAGDLARRVLTGGATAAATRAVRPRRWWGWRHWFTRRPRAGSGR